MANRSLRPSRSLRIVWDTASDETEHETTIPAQRVQIYYGIRTEKPYMVWLLGPNSKMVLYLDLLGSMGLLHAVNSSKYGERVSVGGCLLQKQYEHRMRVKKFQGVSEHAILVVWNTLILRTLVGHAALRVQVPNCKVSTQKPCYDFQYGSPK